MSNSEKSKEDLEKDKLNAEIKHLKRKWYYHPEYLRIAPSLIVAIATSLLAYATYRGDLLNIRIAKFESERQSIEDTIRFLEKERDSLRTTTNFLSKQKDTLQAFLSLKADSIVIVESQLKQAEDSLNKLIGPIKDILSSSYESYVSIHWRTQVAGDDSFKIYVVDENWNPASEAIVNIYNSVETSDDVDLKISGALPNSVNSKGEFGIKLSGRGYKEVILFRDNTDTSPQEMPMLIGPGLRYRVLLKKRVSGSE